MLFKKLQAIDDFLVLHFLLSRHLYENIFFSVTDFEHIISIKSM